MIEGAPAARRTLTMVNTWPSQKQEGDANPMIYTAFSAVLPPCAHKTHSALSWTFSNNQLIFLKPYMNNTLHRITFMNIFA